MAIHPIMGIQKIWMRIGWESPNMVGRRLFLIHENLQKRLSHPMTSQNGCCFFKSIFWAWQLQQRHLRTKQKEQPDWENSKRQQPQEGIGSAHSLLTTSIPTLIIALCGQIVVVWLQASPHTHWVHSSTSQIRRVPNRERERLSLRDLLSLHNNVDTLHTLHDIVL